MKKIITLFVSLVILISCVSVSASAAESNVPGTFFTEEQMSAAQAIKNQYDIDVIFVNFEKSGDFDTLGDATDNYLKEQGITNNYFVLALNDEYYYYSWSDDLSDVFHSIDGAYIVNSISFDENGNILPYSEIEDNYYSFMAVMLKNRIVCPYKYVKDQAGVLTDDQEKTLNEKLSKFKEERGIDLVVVLTNGIDTGKVYRDDRMDFADDYYDYNGYDENGALLLVNIGEFDVYSQGNSWISTAGSCIFEISDDDISKMGSRLTPYLVDGEFYEAASLFPVLVGNILTSNRTSNILLTAVIVFVFGLIVAFVYTGKLKKQLKSVAIATEANRYVVENSLSISRSYDHYLYSHVTKTAKSSSSSGSSSHTSSSGSSHGGGGF